MKLPVQNRALKLLSHKLWKRGRFYVPRTRGCITSSKSGSPITAELLCKGDQLMSRLLKNSVGTKANVFIVSEVIFMNF